MVICAIAKIFLEGRIRGEGFVFEGRVILMDLEVLFERRNARWLFLYTFTLYTYTIIYLSFFEFGKIFTRPLAGNIIIASI